MDETKKCDGLARRETKSLELYDLIKDKVKFGGDKCTYVCLMTCNECSDIDSPIDYCCLFGERLIKEKRCQQCIDIFGE